MATTPQKMVNETTKYCIEKTFGLDCIEFRPVAEEEFHRSYRAAANQ
jgi:hypothetical protein